MENVNHVYQRKPFGQINLDHTNAVIRSKDSVFNMNMNIDIYAISNIRYYIRHGRQIQYEILTLKNRLTFPRNRPSTTNSVAFSPNKSVR